MSLNRKVSNLTAEDRKWLARVITWRVLIPVVVLIFAVAFALRANNIAACGRGGVQRTSQLHTLNDLVIVNQIRIGAASSKPEAEANRDARNRYAKDRLELIDSQKEVALDPNWHQTKNWYDVPPDETVLADCSGKSYPNPWPFSLPGLDKVGDQITKLF